MATHRQCLRAIGALVLTIVFVMAFSNQAHADDLKRIRTESPTLSTVMTTAFDRSATFRSLVERIEQSDVIVYLTCERFDATNLNGRTALATARLGVRYLRVEIRCQQSDQALAAIVAHELQHVVEIASTASVVDQRSFARLFSEIGFATCRSPWSEQFETMAALQTGERVRRELIHRPDLGVQASDHAARRASVRAD
jgi:hypothetical protein